MKHSLVIFLVSLLMVACGKNEDEPQIPLPVKDQAPVTVWAYLVADNDIKSAIRNNIKTMYEGLSLMEKQATLLIYWDGGNDTYVKSSHCILRYTTDGHGNINGTAARDSSYHIRFIAEEGEIVKEYPTQLSTDKTVMASVLKDLKSLSPTSQIALLAGSHGSSWTNSISTQTRSFGLDGYGTKNTITTSDMAAAIEEAGVELDLLLFDACLMGTAEVCYDFRNVANYMIVSPIESPGPGFPYKESLHDIYEGTVEGYKNVCIEDIDHYRNRKDGYDWSAISLVDCSQLDELADLIKQEIVEHKDKIAKFYPIDNLQQYGVTELTSVLSKNFYYVSFDMMQFMNELNENNVPTELNQCFARTVIYADCLEKSKYYPLDKSKYCGLGMYIPVKQRPLWNNYFKTIEWYSAAGWDNVTFSWE